MMNEGFESYVKDLYNNQSHSDISIVVDNDKETLQGTVAIPAHRLVLATMSDYFRTMLYGSFIETNKSEIRLHGVPYSTFQQCLRFMYLGWDSTLDRMTVEEGIEFYLMARMLLMEPKLIDDYFKWITKQVTSCEKQFWKIMTMAVEYDLPAVVKHCLEYFSDIANEFLVSEGFRTVPLSIIRTLISCKKMNCPKVFLIKAIENWIASNSVTPVIKKELLESVRSKKAPFFKGNRVNYYDDSRKEVELYIPPTKSGQNGYSSKLRFQKCVMLVGVSIFLKKPTSEQVNFKAKGYLNLSVKISPSEDCSGYNSDNDSDYPSLSRIATVAYDFRRRNLDEVTIFFPKIKICVYRNYTFTFNWTGDGDHPKIHNFGNCTKFGSVVTCGTCYVAGVYKTLASGSGGMRCDSCQSDKTRRKTATIFKRVR